MNLTPAGQIPEKPARVQNSENACGEVNPSVEVHWTRQPGVVRRPHRRPQRL